MNRMTKKRVGMVLAFSLRLPRHTGDNRDTAGKYR